MQENRFDLEELTTKLTLGIRITENLLDNVSLHAFLQNKFSYMFGGRGKVPSLIYLFNDGKLIFITEPFVTSNPKIKDRLTATEADAEKYISDNLALIENLGSVFLFHNLTSENISNAYWTKTIEKTLKSNYPILNFQQMISWLFARENVRVSILKKVSTQKKDIYEINIMNTNSFVIKGFSIFMDIKGLKKLTILPLRKENPTVLLKGLISFETMQPGENIIKKIEIEKEG